MSSELVVDQMRTHTLASYTGYQPLLEINWNHRLATTDDIVAKCVTNNNDLTIPSVQTPIYLVRAFMCSLHNSAKYTNIYTVILTTPLQYVYIHMAIISYS